MTTSYYSHPRPLGVLFSLQPVTEGARQAVSHPSNNHLVSVLNDGQHVLDIGHIQPISDDKAIVATIGRNGDVVVANAQVGRIQCAFEINLESKVIMFSDRSFDQSSQVFGQGAVPFVEGRTRTVVVQQGINSIIGMGGTEQKLIMFKLIWHDSNPEITRQRVSRRQGGVLRANPRHSLAPLGDLSFSTYNGRDDTDNFSLMLKQPEKRIIQGAQIGKGAFGTVYKATDIDTGRLMAVKKIQRHMLEDKLELSLLKRETKILSDISHVSYTLILSGMRLDLLKVLPAAYCRIFRIGWMDKT